MINETYHWTVSLDVDCPHCRHNFDANETPDFFDQLRGKQVCEGVENVSVTCPQCDGAFNFNIGEGT